MLQKLSREIVYGRYGKAMGVVFHQAAKVKARIS